MQALTLTMIAYATFAHSPPESLLTAVSEHAVVSLSKFEQQAIANLIWALALLHALSPQMWNQLLEAFSSVDDLQGNSDAVTVYASDCLHLSLKPDCLCYPSCVCAVRTCYLLGRLPILTHAYGHLFINRKLSIPMKTAVDIGSSCM